MSKFLTFLVIYLFALTCLGQDDFFGYGNSDDDNGWCFTFNEVGGYVLAGSVRGENNNSEQISLVSIDSTGNIIWEKEYGDEFHEIPRSIEQTSDGGYIIFGLKWKGGYGRLDGYLLKLDQLGNKQWDKYLGAHTREEGFSVKETQDGGYITCGLSGANGIFDYHINKLDSTGNLIWERILGDIGKDIAFDIIESSNGDIIVTGEYSGFYGYSTFEFKHEHSDAMIYSLDSDGNINWTETYGGTQNELAYQTIEGPNGNYYMIGSTQSSGNGSFDIYLVKIDQSGTVLWEKTFGGPGFDYGMSLSLSSDGNIYLLGSTNNDPTSNKTDIVVTKVDLNGNEIWSSYLGGSDSDYGNYIRANEWGGCALIGSSRSYSNIGDDDFIFYQLDSDGNINQWTYDEFITIYVYPNPAVESIQFSILGNQDCFNYPIQISDASGKTVYSEIIDSKFIAIDLTSYSSGTYFYEIKSDCLEPLIGKFIVR